LQRYIRGDLFVLGAQPLDTSLLSLCQHNEMLLPANLPQCPYLTLRFPQHFMGVHCQDCGDSDLSPRLSPRYIPQTTRRRSHQMPTDNLIQRGICPPGESGWRPQIHNGTCWGAETSERREAPLVRLVRTRVQIQVCLRRQKGRLITSQRLLVTTFWGEAMSLRFREQGRSGESDTPKS
jgi:hypothetical protein